MMENYEDIRIEHTKTKEIAEVRVVNIEENSEYIEFERESQNFNFGAEILTTKIMSATSTTTTTNTTKTNGEIKTKIFSSVQEEATVIEKPADLPPKTIITTNDKNIEQIIIDDEEDDESYGKLESTEQSDDESSTESDFSDVSGLSDMSGREWKPTNTRPINWVQKQIHSGVDPRELLSQMMPTSAQQIAPGLNDMTLWRILASMLSEPPRREKLRNVNSFDDVIELVRNAKKIIVLTGAGVSVSCGIPDFRSSDGIYSRLAHDYPDLPDPQAMFDINYFSRDPRPFYKFAREIYPGLFKPSPCHRFIKLLEKKGKLLRNYTQNIDTLEQVAGIENVIECHGSFSTASCTKCRFKCNADDIRADIFAQRIPVCPNCQPNVHQSVDASVAVSEFELRQIVENGIMKPDIVFFGEGLPEEFHTVMASDKDKCDLLIVMGSSLKVRPVALIPSSIPAHVPQILINREQLHHLEFDVELLGDGDVIINQLCHRLGEDWKQICYDSLVLTECKELLPSALVVPIEEVVEQQQLLLQQDNDTQSIKSNASTDEYALRSAAGAYSDSGFESSPYSLANMEAKPVVAGLQAKHEAIEKIKTSILVELIDADNLNTLKSHDELLPVDLLDDPIEAAINYERLCAETEHGRHLSIDSSKDSGIGQCDSSNPALLTGSTIQKGEALLPPLENFGETGGTTSAVATAPAAVDQTIAVNETCEIVATCSDNDILATASTSTSTTNNATVTLTEYERDDIENPATPTQLKLHRQQQMAPPTRLSAAERLPPGTYFSRDRSASYVFPGAQVTWNSDTEDDSMDGELYAAIDENCCDEEGGLHAAPLSPLLTPSLEAEMVSEITTTTIRAAASSSTTTTTTNNTNTSRFATTRNLLYKRRSESQRSNEDEHDNDDIDDDDDDDDFEIDTCTATITTTKTINDPTYNNISNNRPTNNSYTTNRTVICCSPPPVKKRRSSSELAPKTTTTVNSSSNRNYQSSNSSNSNSNKNDLIANAI